MPRLTDQVPRVHNEDHLHRALGAILGQLPTDPQDPFYGRVKALVMNAAHGPHQRCKTVPFFFVLESRSRKLTFNHVYFLKLFYAFAGCGVVLLFAINRVAIQNLVSFSQLISFFVITPIAPPLM
jgi:hypothetical protein